MVNISTSPFAENNLSSASSNFALPFTLNEKLTLSIYVGVVSFAGTIGNILVIICILNQDINFSVAENPTNCLLLSQAVADLLVSCLSGPTYILAIYEPKRRFLIDSLGRFTAAASIGNLALLTLNRFISIYSSFKYLRIVTPSRTKAAIALSWMISLIFGILADVEHRTNVRQLGEILKFYITLSLVAISGCHMYMYKKARYHKKEIKRLTYRPTGYHGGLEKDLQSVFSLLLICGTFFVTWAPLAIFTLVYKNYNPSAYMRILMSLLTLMYLNSAINPVIYYFRSSKYRRALRHLNRRYNERKVGCLQRNKKHPFVRKEQ